MHIQIYTHNEQISIFSAQFERKKPYQESSFPCRQYKIQNLTAVALDAQHIREECKCLHHTEKLKRNTRFKTQIQNYS